MHFSLNRSMAFSSSSEHYLVVAIKDYGRHLTDGRDRGSSSDRTELTSTCRQQIYGRSVTWMSVSLNMAVLQELRKLANTLVAKSADDKLRIFVLVFPRKQDLTFHANCLQ